MNELFDNCILPDKLSELPSSAGLVLFADSQDLPILLLSAANIRRAAKNKLAEPFDTSTKLSADKLRAGKTKKADLKSITAKIYCETCHCKFRLALEHYKAVKKIFASNYKDHISFVYPWFIEIDFNEKIPFFSITRKPAFKSGEKILGPFSSQKSAAVFLNTLEDAFKLCKRSDLAGNPQRAAGCPYLQMNACCGVCGGKIRPQDYQNIIKDAFEAGVEPAKQIEKLGAEMQRAAKDLNFESAAELKKKIEKLSTLKKQTYRWTGDLEKLKIVHIDKSVKIKAQDSKKKKQTYAVFVMNFFEVIDIGDFVIDDSSKITEIIENTLLKLNGGQQNAGDNSEILERFAIISYFLYRTNWPGLWVNTSEGFDKMMFAQTVREKFKV
ncbi:MAG: UvrB/UvrC motif-containing protein [Sedimentisphaerales bacterium]